MGRSHRFGSCHQEAMQLMQSHSQNVDALFQVRNILLSAAIKPTQKINVWPHVLLETTVILDLSKDFVVIPCHNLEKLVMTAIALTPIFARMPVLLRAVAMDLLKLGKHAR